MKHLLPFLLLNIVFLAVVSCYTNRPISGELRNKQLTDSHAGISVINFVRVKNNRYAETRYYYENNWKVYRDTALSLRYIQSYSLLEVPADSIGNFNFILITEYADSIQFILAEPRFQAIIKAMRPGGPIFLNDFKANDFREIVLSKHGTKLLYRDDRKK